MKRLALAISIVGFSSATAWAADMAVKAPILPPAPIYNWTGFYVGGDIGALWTRGHGRLDPLPDEPFFGTIANTGALNHTGVVGGLHAGYNWQWTPSWVVGIEADWSWTNAKGSFSQPWVSVPEHVNPGLRPGTDASMSIDPHWLATIRGRVGYLVTPTALLYFTGGFAFADVGLFASARNEDFELFCIDIVFKNSKRLCVGWRLRMGTRVQLVGQNRVLVLSPRHQRRGQRF